MYKIYNTLNLLEYAYYSLLNLLASFLKQKTYKDLYNGLQTLGYI